jgi:cytochrome c
MTRARSITIGAAFACFVAALEPGVAEDSSNGKDLFVRRCTGCHALDKNKEGPLLRGVYGRRSGSVPSFSYSETLGKANITWDDATLEKWLTDPDKFLPDNDMAFLVQDAGERSMIIAYLKQLSGK